jgi:hypothetical protein
MAEKYTSWPSFCAPTETERCRFGEVVAKPSISGEASARGVEICMYGFGGGFGDAFFQTFLPTKNNRLFSALAVGVGGRSRARLSVGGIFVISFFIFYFFFTFFLTDGILEERGTSMAGWGIVSKTMA